MAQIRQRWPETKILVRGDSGFCRDPIMVWCEGNGVDYVLGLARNARLQRRIDTGAAQVARKRPVNPVRSRAGAVGNPRLGRAARILQSFYDGGGAGRAVGRSER